VLVAFWEGVVAGGGVVVNGEGGELGMLRLPMFAVFAMLPVLCKEVGLVICYFGVCGVGASSRRGA
jgi:hypothetical protein